MHWARIALERLVRQTLARRHLQVATGFKQMTGLPGHLIREFKEFEKGIDRVRFFLSTRKKIEETCVRQMEELLQETIGCPGVTDIWRSIRALVETEVVQRKVVLKSLDDGLTGLQEAQAAYSDDLFHLTARWAKIEERHPKLCEEYSRAKEHCKDSFLQSKAAAVPPDVPSPHLPMPSSIPKRRALPLSAFIRKGTLEAPPTQTPKNSDLFQADLSYRRTLMNLNYAQREASGVLERSYRKLVDGEQECIEKLQRAARLYGETTIDASSNCSNGGSLLVFDARNFSTAKMVSPVLDKIDLELENSYFRPFQYHDFNFHSDHNYLLFGIDLSHHTQYVEYNSTKVPSILGLLLEDIETRGGDGVEAYTTQYYTLMQLPYNLERRWQESNIENQRLIKEASVTVSGELIKYFFSTLPRRLVYVDQINSDQGGPPRFEIVPVGPRPGAQEQAVWHTMVSHLQRLSRQATPNKSTLQIAAGLAGELGPLLVGCEDPAISVYFLKEFILGVGNSLR